MELVTAVAREVKATKQSKTRRALLPEYIASGARLPDPEGPLN